MDSLTPPSRLARGPGQPALQAHNSPNAQRDDPAGLFTLTPATFFRPHRAGGTTRGQSAREPPPPIARALCLSCRSGNDRFDCVALARVPGGAQRATPMLICDGCCSVCAADPGPFHTPPARRSRFCSASQRNQVYADCVNLSALLRCARDTRSNGSPAMTTDMASLHPSARKNVGSTVTTLCERGGPTRRRPRAPRSSGKLGA